MELNHTNNKRVLGLRSFLGPNEREVPSKTMPSSVTGIPCSDVGRYAPSRSSSNASLRCADISLQYHVLRNRKRLRPRRRRARVDWLPLLPPVVAADQLQIDSLCSRTFRHGEEQRVLRDFHDKNRLATGRRSAAIARRIFVKFCANTLYEDAQTAQCSQHLPYGVPCRLQREHPFLSSAVLAC